MKLGNIRFKKGFTLAEILIVLMVIGALATMTIPSLMKGVQEAQWKTAYKKAYNNVANMIAAEKTTSGLPAIWVDNENIRCYIYDILRKHLSIKAWVKKGDFQINTGAAINKSLINTNTNEATGRMQWLIADDGLTYTLTSGKCTTAGKCTVANINAQSTVAKAISYSTFTILVDVNGLQSLPNKISVKSMSASTATPQLDGDQFYIFIGSDGATAGNPTQLLTGRIVGNIK